MSPSRTVVPAEAPGLAARRIAADIIDNVLVKRRALDEQLDGPAAQRALAEAAARRAAAEKEAGTRPVELQGPRGPEPTRFGDWERKGIASDF